MPKTPANANALLPRAVVALVVGFGAVCYGVAFIVIVIAAMVFGRQAFGHDDAAWIGNGGYRNDVGDLCCGERDCAKLAAADVSIWPGVGFYVASVNEVVPFREASPSPNKFYWRCQWAGVRKCFFAPGGAV